MIAEVSTRRRIQTGEISHAPYRPDRLASISSGNIGDSLRASEQQRLALLDRAGNGDLAALSKLARRVSESGFSDPLEIGAIADGVAKIELSSDYCQMLADAIISTHNDDPDFLKALLPVINCVIENLSLSEIIDLCDQKLKMKVAKEHLSGYGAIFTLLQQLPSSISTEYFTDLTQLTPEDFKPSTNESPAREEQEWIRAKGLFIAVQSLAMMTLPSWALYLGKPEFANEAFSFGCANFLFGLYLLQYGDQIEGFRDQAIPNSFPLEEVSSLAKRCLSDSNENRCKERVP
jgi:hypothetical protein